ncbi:MAG: glycogen/starch synthase, partial [Atribacterota bacterium]|nr:glycogen/starch synthase [Atribacterota bacterium]
IIVRQAQGDYIEESSIKSLPYKVDVLSNLYLYGIRSSDFRTSGKLGLLTGSVRKYILENKISSSSPLNNPDNLTRKPLNIIHVSPEVEPFSKLGGLADVLNGLPQALSEWGHKTYIVSLFYDFMDRKALKIRDTHRKLMIPVGGRIESASVLTAKINGLRVYLLGNPLYSKKPYLGQEISDYELVKPVLKNKISKEIPQHEVPFYLHKLSFEQAVFLSKGALELIKSFELDVDILHLHDWQAALIPVLLKEHMDYKNDERMTKIVSIYSIHNLAYQGVFNKHLLEVAGFDWNVFTIDGLEFYDDINLMKGGIVYSDAVGTVSPTYSTEIITPEFGERLDGILRMVKEKKNNLFGILNGINYKRWRVLPENKDLTLENITEAKRYYKAMLQKELGLVVSPETPIVAVIVRLVEHKGINLVLERFKEMLVGVQFVLIGSGSGAIRGAFEAIADDPRYIGRVSINFGTGSKISIQNKDRLIKTLDKLIYIGADIFLVPSKYAPCELTQIISLANGTIPIVHRTGGLKDTVSNFDPVVCRGNGFAFEEFDAAQLLAKIKEAVSLYKNKQESWQTLIKNAINCDFSWLTASRQYLNIYYETIKKKLSIQWLSDNPEVIGQKILSGELDFDQTLKTLWEERMLDGVFSYPMEGFKVRRIGKFALCLMSEQRIMYDKLVSKKASFGNRPHAEPFNPNRANFNRFYKECPRRRLVNFYIKGRHLAVDINQSPLFYYHMLLLSEPERNQPQLVTKESLELLLSVIELSHNNSLKIGLNAWNWGASVNHLHAQLYYYPFEQGLCVESAQKVLRKNIAGVSIFNILGHYVDAKFFSGSDKGKIASVIVRYKSLLDRYGVANVMLLTCQGAYLLYGKPLVLDGIATSGTGFSEVSGYVYTPDPKIYKKIGEQFILEQLSRLRLSGPSSSPLLKAKVVNCSSPVDKEISSSAAESQDMIIDGENLTHNWHKAVREGKIKVPVVRNTEDSNIEEEIELGVKIVGDATQFYGIKRELRRDTKECLSELELSEAEHVEEIIIDGGIIKQLNKFRGLRPGVTAKKEIGKQKDLLPHHELCQFQCRNPEHKMSLWKQEPLIEVLINGTIWRAYYNASPFEKEGHFLFIPDIADDAQIRDQRLTVKDLLDILKVMDNSQNILIFFNA